MTEVNVAGQTADEIPVGGQGHQHKDLAADEEREAGDADVGVGGEQDQQQQPERQTGPTAKWPGQALYEP